MQQRKLVLITRKTSFCLLKEEKSSKKNLQNDYLSNILEQILNKEYSRVETESYLKLSYFGSNGIKLNLNLNFKSLWLKV